MRPRSIREELDMIAKGDEGNDNNNNMGKQSFYSDAFMSIACCSNIGEHARLSSFS